MSPLLVLKLVRLGYMPFILSVYGIGQFDFKSFRETDFFKNILTLSVKGKLSVGVGRQHSFNTLPED